jgi:hypothetical protein
MKKADSADALDRREVHPSLFITQPEDETGGGYAHGQFEAAGARGGSSSSGLS